MSTRTDLIRRLADHSATVGVIGLGYVGLPLALNFASAGLRVVGIDVDAGKVEAINAGSPTIADVSPHDLAAVLASGAFRATTEFAVLADCDAVSICVPTPLRKTGDPDISYILAATEEVARHVTPGTVVVLESTTYPGTTTEVVMPRLSAREDLEIGETLFLAFSPERIDPGRIDWTVVNTPKVIGGATPACLEVAMAYYGQAIPTLVPVSSTEAAEMVKLLENTFRAVNIGLANETLLMCDRLGLDVWEIIDAAATKPFGYLKFTPGPGLGGHCIPIDPLYLSWKLKTLQYNARFIELASEINASMPQFWVQRVQDTLNERGKPVKGSRILILGVAYKKDVSDLRESPALDILHLLARKGAVVSYHDPYVPAFQHENLEMVGVADLDEAVRSSDCVLVVTDHSSYDFAHIDGLAQAVVDTRRAIRPVPVQQAET